MTISSQASSSLLDNVLQTQGSRADASVALLKKAQDIDKQEGAAMVEMLEKSVTSAPRQSLDTYA